jgi:hypothetical protein
LLVEKVKKKEFKSIIFQLPSIDLPKKIKINRKSTTASKKEGIEPIN